MSNLVEEAADTGWLRWYTPATDTFVFGRIRQGKFETKAEYAAAVIKALEEKE